jgi:hypothetical protein
MLYTTKSKKQPPIKHTSNCAPPPRKAAEGEEEKKAKKTVIAQTRHGTTTEKANTSKLHLKNRQDNSGSQNKNHVKTSPPLYTICQTMPCHAMLCYAMQDVSRLVNHQTKYATYRNATCSTSFFFGL